jgi:hypothetical protein
MKRILFLLFISLSLSVFSQTDSGDLEVYLNTKLSNIPGKTGNDYKVPTSGNLTTWGNIISAILIDDITTARTQAATVNYQVVTYTNTSLSLNRVFYVLEEKSSQTNYWGTYVFSKISDRNNLVLQAPHSAHDFNTGKQAIYAFNRLNNKALFLNGTQRCNNATASSCDGTTTVCSGSSAAFRVSDQAHNSNNMFQKTTEILFNQITNSVFIQLHGFSKKSTDPYVIISNGTDKVPATDYGVMIKNQLLAADNSLTFKLAHIDTNWDRLRGFSNTQGRFINGSSNPCSVSASATSGRFIHLEQEKTKLRQDAAGWEKMNMALSNVFAKTLSVDNFSKEIVLNSTNPFKNSITFSAKNITKVELLNILGKSVFSKFTNDEDILIDTKTLSAGIYFLKVHIANSIYTKKMIRE